MTDAPAAEQTTRAPRPGGVCYTRHRPAGVPAETFAQCEEEQFAQLIDFAYSASIHIPVEIRRRGRRLVVVGERFEFPTPAAARRAHRRLRRAGYDRRRPARSLSRAHRRLQAQQHDLYWWAIEFTGDTPF